MLFILIIAVWIQWVILFYFFTKLNQIESNTNGDFFLNLLTKFHSDKILRKVNYIFEMPVGNKGVINLVSNESQELIYYLDFLEFVAALGNRELEMDDLGFLFAKQFGDLHKHQEICEKYVAEKRINIQRYLRLFYRRDDKGLEILVPGF